MSLQIGKTYHIDVEAYNRRYKAQNGIDATLKRSEVYLESIDGNEAFVRAIIHHIQTWIDADLLVENQ